MTPDELLAIGLRFDVDGPVATLTLDRPASRNSQTPTMWRAMAALGSDLGDDVRVVVVRGAGPTFSAGLDRSMLTPGGGDGQESVAALMAMDDEQMSATIADYQAGFRWLRDPAIVSIAAVQGYAIGAGFQLALSCDVVLAADTAQFCMKEPALGLVPDLTGTKPLVERVGYSRALEMTATARMVDAEEAGRIGIANQVVPEGDLDAAVSTLVAALTAPIAGAVRETKALYQSALHEDLDTQCRLEREAQTRRFREMAALLQG